MAPYILSEDQVESYHRNGHICLRGLIPKSEITRYRDEIRLLVARLNTEHRSLDERDTYGKAFLQIFNLWRESELAREFVLSRRLGDVAAQLLGADRVRIYHDQALFKEGGGGHTPWHQDQFYWPLDTDNMITMWMPLVDLSADMGIMQFVSGSHKAGYLLESEISDTSDAFFESYIASHGLNIHSEYKLDAGDATFHSGWTLHSAPPNLTSTMREVMTIIYFPDNTRILKPDNTFREQDLNRWLGGRQPGEIADSAMNPLASSVR